VSVPVIQLEDFRKTYTSGEVQVHAVRGVNLTIQPGEAAPVNIQLANGNPGAFTGSLTFNLSGTGLLTVENIPIIANLSLTSTEELQSSTETMLFPNPAREHICLALVKGTQPANFSLIDLQGRILRRGTANNEHCIDVADFAPGVYFLQYEGQGESHPQRWVKD